MCVYVLCVEWLCDLSMCFWVWVVGSVVCSCILFNIFSCHLLLYALKYKLHWVYLQWNVLYKSNSFAMRWSESGTTEKNIETVSPNKKINKKCCYYIDSYLPSRGYSGCGLQDHRRHGKGCCCHNDGRGIPAEETRDYEQTTQWPPRGAGQGWKGISVCMYSNLCKSAENIPLTCF